MHDVSKLIIPYYVNNIIENSTSNLNKFTAENQIEFVSKWCEQSRYKRISECSHQEKLEIYREIISLEHTYKDSDKNLQDYLKSVILNSNITQRMDGKAYFLLRQITKAFISNPQQLPNKTIYTLLKNYCNINGNSGQNLRNAIAKVEGGSLTGNQYVIFREHLKKLHIKKDELYLVALIRTIEDYVLGMTD